MIDRICPPPLSYPSVINQIGLELIEGDLIIAIFINVDEHLLNLPLIRLFKQILNLLPRNEPSLVLIDKIKGILQGPLGIHLVLDGHCGQELVEVDLAGLVLVHVVDDVHDFLLPDVREVLLVEINEFVCLDYAAVVVVYLEKHF